MYPSCIVLRMLKKNARISAEIEPLNKIEIAGKRSIVRIIHEKQMFFLCEKYTTK